MPSKSPEAFRTIAEAAEELSVPPHVLRFWESKFTFVRPMKRAGGRRFYRPHDLALLRGVKRLLHDEGYTIKGVQKVQREQGVRRLLAAAGVAEEEIPVLEAQREAAASGADRRSRLETALRELESAKTTLDAAIGGAVKR